VGSLCSTRLLKNAKFLQGPDVGFFPQVEPPDGFLSLVPYPVLSRLERIPREEIGIAPLARALSRRTPPSPQAKLATPPFSGTLRFVRAAFTSSGASFTVPDADLGVAINYALLAVGPISEYCSQYGPNSLSVADVTLPFSASVPSGKYNDGILSGWVDQLAKANGFGPDSCLVFLNPQGVVNTDADATQGVLGYHNLSSSGVPYAFVNVMGKGLTIDDRMNVFALALSHEIAEMTVDPEANGSNPEVCDQCSGNCSVDYRNYFDQAGGWLGGSAAPGYHFFINGIAAPASATRCPAPASSCTYPPPGQGQGAHHRR
jgi:hypothetical protein